MKTATPFSNSFTLTINPGLNFSFPQTTFPQGKNPPAFIPQTPFCGREISRGFAKSFSPENSFRKTESELKPRHTVRILGGQNHKKKNVLSILEKIAAAQNQKSKEHFFFLGLPSEARRWRGFRSSRIFDKIGSSEVIKTLQFCRKRYRRPKSVGRAERGPPLSPPFFLRNLSAPLRG